jgi:hypothetical protein
MTDKYILEGKTPKPASLDEWARWYQTAERHVAMSEQEGVKVSTVFLGLDHSFGRGEPLLFETMIFGGEHDQWQDRCSTWDQAVVMHCKACELAGVPYKAD